MAGLNLRSDPCSLDFLSLGAMVHRLDPGTTPFRKARSFEVHVSGGEYNVAANLSDCFRLRTGVCTAMVDYGIGELVQARVRETGVTPFYKWFGNDGVRGPNLATVYSDRGRGRARAGRLLQPRQRGGGPAQARRLRLGRDPGPGRALVPFGRHLRGPVGDHVGADPGGAGSGAAGRGRRLVRPQLPRQALGRGRRPGGAPRPYCARSRPTSTC